MPDQYYHTPLQHPRHIRILHLAPAEDSAAPIQCQLDTISLDNHSESDGDYAALSYTWESQMPSCEVICNGDSLLITANCDAALRELRDISETIKLWIDSICIDQSYDAVEERNIQVALMGEIYKYARRVVVWLGRSDIWLRRALDLVTEMASLAKDSTAEDRQLVQGRPLEKVHEISNKVHRQSEDPFSPLFRCSWFHRMWTIQEVTLSWPDRIVLRCGNIQTPWSDLVTAVEILEAAKYQWCRWKEAMSLQRHLVALLARRRYQDTRALLNDPTGEPHSDPVVTLILLSTRSKKSMDPKDRIFALSSLFKELKIPFPAPDYSRSTEDAYRVATISCINHDKNLSIVSHAPSDRRRNGLASWVPDFTDEGWDAADPRYSCFQPQFMASGRSGAKWSFLGDGTGLVLVGKIIDTIIFCADPMLGLESIRPELEFRYAVAKQNLGYGQVLEPDMDAEYLRLYYKSYSVLRSWVDMSRWSDYPTGESTKEALRRTLVNDEPRLNMVAAEDNSFDRWYDSMLLEELGIAALAFRRDYAAIRDYPTMPGQQQLSETFLREYMLRSPKEELVFRALRGPSSRFHGHVIAITQKKRLFLTEKHYIGTAADPLPVPIEPDDRIAVVRGLHAPLVLRPVEGGYRLLTHAYVHGIMYGEAWPQNEDSLEDIVLL